MLDPLELQVFPSCYNCISWSEDGEIAVATGEYVQVLTPTPPSKREANGNASHFSSTDWHTTRFRANVFTVSEWPIMFPQPRDRFSVGAEQSMSTVVGVAWSSPGLARYRRSVLAVLTSNMVLSIYALIGTQGKWTRIAIVNKALESHFREDVGNDTPRSPKSNVRSFTWTPPLKIPTENLLLSGPESRWGIALLAVTNDDNDMVFLKVQPPAVQDASLDTLRVEAVYSVSLPVKYDHIVQPGSVFASALQSGVRTLSLASGPWLYHSQQSEVNDDGPLSATLNVAGIQETKLRVVKLNFELEPLMDVSGNEPSYNLLFNAVENTAFPIQDIGDFHLTGPIHWAHKIGSDRMSIAVGGVAGLALINLPAHIYSGQNVEDGDTDSHYYPMVENSMYGIERTGQGHYGRISGMTVAADPDTEAQILHFGTVGGYAAIKPLANGTEIDAPTQAPWNYQVEEVRERFDIDRDLGGLAVSRIWGLSSTHGLMAAAVTLHPGDMVEYRTNAEDRVTIVFSTASGQPVHPESVPFLRGNPTNSIEFIRERRDVVLQYILGTANDNGAKRTLSSKVLYAAACCAIVQSQNAELLSNARGFLERLAATSGVDVTDEVAKCYAPGSTIDAKSADELNAPSADIFEKCEVCDTGIAWYSAQEAQCATGHVFVRCSLTGLVIQEPGISKFCSKCDREYIDEDLITLSPANDTQQACKSLSDVFDTCIYCNGRFRP
ncbi:transcription factor IIIC subunit delta N-term-domain-containing protein [Aspergillus cavernicola]|uniref:Transcription factor IIIC subunit delta N-term-domain-containing protein n=1 Tax=Aspergillus cavernicola TaxID=176166 RepID=A0ABR4HPS6_9EURO